jgi:hypothetical protein
MNSHLVYVLMLQINSALGGTVSQAAQPAAGSSHNNTSQQSTTETSKQGSRRNRERKKPTADRGSEAPPVIVFKRQPPGHLKPGEDALWVAFEEMDLNGDGHLDWVELRSALERLGLPCTPEWVALHQIHVQWQTV